MNDLRQMQEAVRDSRWVDRQEPDQQPAARPWWVTYAVLGLGLLPPFAIAFYFVYL
jgi:hypothetical protein